MSKGDNEFAHFLEGAENEDQDIKGIIEALDKKIKALTEIYSKTLDYSQTIGENQQVRTTTNEFIKYLMSEIKLTLSNFDYALLMDEDEDDGDTPNC